MTRARLSLSRAAGDIEKTLEGHTNWVTSVVWSPDGERLASTGSFDGTVKIWNLETGASFLSSLVRGRTTRARLSLSLSRAR